MAAHRDDRSDPNSGPDPDLDPDRDHGSTGPGEASAGDTGSGDDVETEAMARASAEVEAGAPAGGPRPGRLPRRGLVAVGLGAVVIAVLAVAALTGGSGGDGDGRETGDARDAAPAATGAGAQATAVPTIQGPRPPSLDPALMLGRPDAKVIIVEFGDYQCPSCGRYAREIKPVLVRKYVNAGIVRLAWRDFPTYGSQSVAAAVAARAAARQGRFWQFHDALYGRRLPLRSGRLTAPYLRGVAQQVGLDLSRYDSDVRDRALRRAVDADFGFGQQLGVPGTPAFLINGKAFFGAQPLAAFERAIAAARAES
jgi:protein-disulfide isomerase